MRSWKPTPPPYVLSMKPKLALGIKFRGFSFEEGFAIAKDAGFDGVNFLPSYTHLLLSPKDIIGYSKTHDIPVIGIHEQLQLVLYTPSFLFPRMLYLTTFFPHADTYVVHLSSLLNPFQYNTKKIKQLVLKAKEKGITIAFESNPIFPLLQRYPKETYEPEKFGNFCAQHGLAITFDTSHIASVGGNIVDFYKRYHQHIRVIHLSDFQNGVQHLPLGQGSLPLERLCEEMKRTNYAHNIVFELDSFPSARSKQDKVQDIKRSVDSVKNYLR